MNTMQSELHTLQAGEALTVARGRSSKLIVAEGEVLVQAPAQWLAGIVLVPPPRRVSGPASLELDGTESVMAIRHAKIMFEAAASPLTRMRLAWDLLGLARLGRLSRSRPQPRHA
jgi:hypothetical protein